MDALLDAGLCNALLAGTLALPVACAARLLRRPALAHVLWLLVLLKLLTPPLVELPLPWPGEAPPEAVPAAAPSTDPEEPATFDPAEPEEEPGAPPRIAPTLHAPAPVAWFKGWTWRPAAAAVWLTGTLVWLAVVALRVRRFGRLLRHARPAPAAVHEQARRLAERLGLARCPGVLLIDAPLSPLLWAFAGSPRLLLPAALWDRLAEEQRDTLLAHELAHLRRGDHCVRWLELAVVGLYWWHPVVWLALRELREAEEQCCDAWVVWALPSSGPAYARALVETVAFLSQPRPPLPVGASGVGRVRLLKRRLAMIVRGNTPRSLSWPGYAAVLGLGLLLLPLIPTWAQRPDEGTKEAKTGAAPQDEARDRAAELLNQFNTLYKEGRYAEAEECAREALKREPDNPALAAAFKVLLAQRKRAEDRPAGDTPSGPADPPTKPAPGPDRSEDLQKAQDEVELLEVQLEVKKAQQEAAKASLPRAREREQQLRKMSAAGTGQQSAWVQAMHEVAELEGQLLVKEAELREPELRLKQARRRLANLQRVAEPQGQESWAEALFEELFKDFGAVEYGATLTHRFRLVNRTKKPVHVAGVRTSSSAVTATVQQADVEPGKETAVVVKVDAGRFVGAKTAHVVVQFDRPEVAESTLLVRANSRDDLPGKKPADDPKADEDRMRLKELEKKIDALLKELESLRRTKQQSWFKIPADQAGDVIVTSQRNMKIPLRVDLAQRGQVKALYLLASRDEGKTWENAAQPVGPDAEAFDFRAPADGLYWLGVAVIDADGRVDKDYERGPPALKVLVKKEK